MDDHDDIIFGGLDGVRRLTEKLMERERCVKLDLSAGEGWSARY